MVNRINLNSLLQRNREQTDSISFMAHPPRKSVEEIDFDEHLFDISDSIDTSCTSVCASPGYDHQTFMTIFDYHQNGVQQDTLEQTLEDLEDPTKCLSLSPIASLDVPVASLAETIKELEETLRSSTSVLHKSPKVPRKRHTVLKIICEICGKGFANESRLELHRISHRDEKFLECPHCCKSFKWAFALKRHVKLHQDNREHYQCGICEKSFRFERYLKVIFLFMFSLCHMYDFSFNNFIK